MIGALVAGQVGSGGASLSSYESIATASGTGSSGIITFSVIPSTFKHLQIRGINRSTTAGVSFSQLNFTCNGDTGNNYAQHYLKGDGSAVSASGYATGGYGGILLYNCMARAGMASGIMGTFVIDILDYGSTSKYKTVRVLCGGDTNGAGEIGINSGLWLSTSAISSLSVIATAGNFTTDTSIALYGIKEA